MKTSPFLAVALAGAFSVASASAEELKSGVETGGKIGTYKSTKCGGIDDGVQSGKSLCYT